MSNENLTRVDLCCGTSKPGGFIGVDSFPGNNVDIVADLNERFPFEDNSVDMVRAHDAIEHLPDKIHTMNEIWRICKPNATVDILVPSTDGRGAFQDPTHVSYWNINSFLYYSVDHAAYYELCKRYGFRGGFKIENIINLSGFDNIVHVQAILRVIK
ncbi:MAG: class I SAM-dependent methyltransferase [Acidobacteria bacterium]|nr:class I SAM-dependent methyltransferase [Acidobacteriota bacterium]